jgi:YesN/AraC family two-component response regulator
MTTVLIADDQALVRVGLRKILDAEPDTDVVGEANDGEEAVSETRRLRPDVVLMDIRMPVLDGSRRRGASRRRSRAHASSC